MRIESPHCKLYNHVALGDIVPKIIGSCGKQIITPPPFLGMGNAFHDKMDFNLEKELECGHWKLKCNMHDVSSLSWGKKYSRLVV